MKIKNIDDIQREIIEKEHQEMKDKIVNDTTEVFGKVRDNIKKQNDEKKKKRSLITRWFISMGVLIAFLCVVNLILLNLWVLRWVIKSLFG